MKKAGFTISNDEEKKIKPGESNGYAYYEEDGTYRGTIFIFEYIGYTIYPVHSQADGRYDLDIEWTIRDEYGTLIDTAEDTVNVEPLDKQKVTHKFKVDKYREFTA